MSQMSQLGSNVFIGRVDGESNDVRLVVLASPPIFPPQSNQSFAPGQALLDITIPANTWVTATTGVSRRGHVDGRFYIAQAFHSNAEPFAQWAGEMAQMLAQP